MASATSLTRTELWRPPKDERWAEAIALVEAVQAPAAIFTLDRASAHANEAALACGVGPSDFDELLGPAAASDRAGGSRCTGRVLCGRANGSSRHPGNCVPLRIDGLELLLCVLSRCPHGQSQSSPPEAKLRRLPPRQARVALLVMRGLTDKEIAHRLELSHHTVRTYVRQVLQRMGVHSRAELVSRLWMPETDQP